MDNAVKTLLFALLLVTTSGLFAQNDDSYFKLMPVVEESDPEWVQLMYSNDPSAYDVVKLYESYHKENTFVKTIHTQNYKFWLKQIAGNLDVDGHIRVNRSSSTAYLEDLKNRRSTQRGLNTWTTLGPFETFTEDANAGVIPVSWQVNVYCVDQSVSNPNTVYAGTEGMGAWKSIDKGLNWFSITKNEDVTWVGDIKVAPSNENIVFLSSRNGILKSQNGGASWLLVLQEEEAYQIIIHPTDPDTVFVVGPNGLHKTYNGGTTWTQQMTSKCWDINFHPTNPSIVYLLKHNSSLQYAEFWKSDDTGITWNQKTTGWYNPVNPAFTNHIDYGALIAVTPLEPSKVYVGMMGNHKQEDNAWIGVYRSENAGESWSNPIQDGGPYSDPQNQNLATVNRTGGFTQGFYDFGFDASHTVPGKLYLGVLALSVSTNSGDSWTRIGAYDVPAGNDVGWIHPDIQDIHVLGGDVWVATDGGINYSKDELATHESRKKGLSGSHFWGMDQGWNEDIIVGGRYHNGNTALFEQYGIGNSTRLGGAEAATGYTDLLNPLKNYFSDIQTVQIDPTTVGELSYSGQLSLYPHESFIHGLSSEIVRDPAYANHLYLGASAGAQDGGFWKSTDNGASFKLLHNFGPNKVTGIEIPHKDPHIIYCVYDGNKIYRSSDSGTSWKLLSPLATSSNLLISVNPSDPQELWAFANTAASTGKVFRTRDSGQTWQDLTTPKIQSMTINDGVYQGGSNAKVYIVGSYELLVWDENSTEWIDYHDGLPFVMGDVKNIFKPFYRDSKLRLSSVRGIWEAPFVASSQPIAQPMTATDIVQCARDTVQFDDHSILDHSNATWEWTFSPEPMWINSKSIRNPKVLLKDGLSYDVTLKVIDGGNRSSTKTVINMVTVQSQCEVSRSSLNAINLTQEGNWAQTPNLKIKSNTVTISAWFKPHGVQPEFSSIVMNDNESAGFNLSDNSNTLGYHWPGGAWWWDSGLKLPVDQWSHVAMVASPTSMTLYLNGIASTHVTNLDAVDLGTMKIGSFKGRNGRNLKGQIDEVCIWNRSLSQNEIRQLRHLTKDPAQDSDIVAYYQFDEMDGAVLDRAKTNHAALVGSTQRVLSTAPVGNGVSDRVQIPNSGNYSFTNAGIEMSISSNMLSPNGEVVITRINTLPDSINDQKVPFKQYWVFNNYGANKNPQIENLTITPTQQIPPHLIPSPSDSKLIWRHSNEHLNNWVQLKGANSVQTTELTYQNIHPSSLGQFFIQDHNCPLILDISNINIEKNMTLYAKNEIKLGDFSVQSGLHLSIESQVIEIKQGQTFKSSTVDVINKDGCANN